MANMTLTDFGIGKRILPMYGLFAYVQLTELQPSESQSLKW